MRRLVKPRETRPVKRLEKPPETPLPTAKPPGMATRLVRPSAWPALARSLEPRAQHLDMQPRPE